MNYFKINCRYITPLDYNSFLTKIKKHKFMICPMGNADCHRNWEVLYLGRVPIMRKVNI
jgi:hypothetical protein